MNCHIIYVTCPHMEEARTIGNQLVEENMVACVNLLSGMESIYRWEGKIQQGREVVLLAKTTAARVDEVMARVVELHSYEVPCVVAWPIEKGNPDFLKWIEGECG